MCILFKEMQVLISDRYACKNLNTASVEIKVCAKVEGVSPCEEHSSSAKRNLPFFNPNKQ